MEPTNWNKKEFLGYVLLYCANGDFVITEEETSLIESKVGLAVLDKVKEEFEVDTDFQRIQKIQSTVDALNYSNEQLEQIINDIQELFFSDGEFGTLEKNLLLALKHVLV